MGARARLPAATPSAPPPTLSAAEAAQPLPTLLDSHKRVLGNIRAICDGQLALAKSNELGARLTGEGARGTYLTQMELLCQQQRLLACQLHDIVLAQKIAHDEAAAAATSERAR